jgi:hypothetical protein
MPMPPQGTNYYGRYALTAARLLLVPQMVKGRITLVPPTPQAVREPGAGVGPIKNADRLRDRYRPYGKSGALAPAPAPAPPPPPPPPPPAPPPPPPISAVGVNDIGIGNCNMLIDINMNVQLYYDVGYPLWFFVSSAPNTVRIGMPAYLGPILTNGPPNTLSIILSHWDWDHWRYGRITNLNLLPWYVPNQPLGPVALAFFNTIAVVVHNPMVPTVVALTHTLYQCAPIGPMPAAALLNNTGLALRTTTLLPIGDPLPHDIVLTGDANRNTLPGAPYANATGMVAVHHGSNAHGAGAGLPAPTFPYAAAGGRIAYSYGITGGGGHAYGFPVAAAVAAYNANGWVQQMSTAEGPNINVGPTAHGNIRMGNQAALNPLGPYAGTAFFAIGYPLP